MALRGIAEQSPLSFDTGAGRLDHPRPFLDFAAQVVGRELLRGCCAPRRALRGDPIFELVAADGGDDLLVELRYDGALRGGRAMMACPNDISKLFNPGASFTVGRSGRVAERCGSVTALARNRPEGG